MDVYVRLIEIYEKQGIKIGGGLFPWHFDRNYPVGATRLHVRQPFMSAVSQGAPLQVGGGISPLEVLILSSVSRAIQPKRIFIIGNAFGWSTFALGLANPQAKIVAMDALLEGREAHKGFALTQKIINDEGLENISVVEALSPDDVSDVCRAHFDGPIDFAFIDGEHTNEQQTKDVHAVLKELADPGILFLHDVLNWNMVSSFTAIRQSNPNLVGKILMRTPSGMGVLYSKTIPTAAEKMITAFCESKEVILRYQKEVVHCRQKIRDIMGFGMEIKEDWENKDTRITILKND